MSGGINREPLYRGNPNRWQRFSSPAIQRATLRPIACMPEALSAKWAASWRNHASRVVARANRFAAVRCTHDVSIDYRRDVIA
jgi:hypothetical protein